VVTLLEMSCLFGIDTVTRGLNNCHTPFSETLCVGEVVKSWQLDHHGRVAFRHGVIVDGFTVRGIPPLFFNKMPSLLYPQPNL
jgi:hypothetical protein